MNMFGGIYTEKGECERRTGTPQAQATRLLTGPHSGGGGSQYGAFFVHQKSPSSFAFCSACACAKRAFNDTAGGESCVDDADKASPLSLSNLRTGNATVGFMLFPLTFALVLVAAVFPSPMSKQLNTAKAATSCTSSVVRTKGTKKKSRSRDFRSFSASRT